MIEKGKALTVTLYRHSAIRYLFVGGTTFILDFSLLVLFHGVLHIDLAIATTMAYWIAVVYNFSLNRWWTFSASENNSLRKHVLPYGLLLGFNYLFTVVFVVLVSRVLPYEISKIIAVPIQMTWTYPIFKKIFGNKKESNNT